MYAERIAILMCGACRRTPFSQAHPVCVSGHATAQQWPLWESEQKLVGHYKCRFYEFTA